MTPSNETPKPAPTDLGADPAPSTDRSRAAADRAALDRLRPALAAIPADAVGPFRASVRQAVANALKVAEAFAADRERLAATFRPEAFDPAEHADVGERAQALWQADIDLRLAESPATARDEALERALPLRRALLRAATYLWEEDPVLGPKVAAIRSGRGHLDAADDLRTLAELLGARWEEVSAGTTLSSEELDGAVAVAGELAAHTGPRRTPRELAELRDLRDRAGLHLQRAVDEIRAAVGYVSRHADDPLAGYPSVFTHPRSRSASPAAPGAPATDAGEPEGDPASERAA